MHYKWLFIFLDRLTVWLREHSQEKGACKNDYISITPEWDKYRFTLRNGETSCRSPQWTSYRQYKKLLEKVNSSITKEFFTSASLIKYFPNLMLVPFPVDASVSEMNTWFPSPDNPFALVGFTNRISDADRRKMPSDTFWGHDVVHWAALILTLNSISFAVYENPDWELLLSKNFQTTAKKILIAQRKAFYKTLKFISHQIELLEDEEQRLIFPLILFEVYHESVLCLHQRIVMIYGSLLCDDLDNQSLLGSQHQDRRTGVLINYLSGGAFSQFLPTSWRRLNDEEITAKVKTCLAEFRELLAEKVPHDEDIKEALDLPVTITGEETAAFQFQLKNRSVGPTGLAYVFKDQTNCEEIRSPRGMVRIFQDRSLEAHGPEDVQIRLIFNDDNPFDLDSQSSPGVTTYEVFISRNHPCPNSLVQKIKRALAGRAPAQ